MNSNITRSKNKQSFCQKQDQMYFDKVFIHVSLSNYTIQDIAKEYVCVHTAHTDQLQQKLKNNSHKIKLQTIAAPLNQVHPIFHSCYRILMFSRCFHQTPPSPPAALSKVPPACMPAPCSPNAWARVVLHQEEQNHMQTGATVNEINFHLSSKGIV